MNFTSKIIFSSLFFVLLFSACDRENIDEIISETEAYRIDTVVVNPIVKSIQSFSPDSINLDCVSIPFPVDLVQTSGNVVTANSQTELDSLSMLPDSLADFVYPFDAVDATGLVTIQNVGDLVIAIATCPDPVPVSDCSRSLPHVLLFFNALDILTINKYPYTIHYPVTLDVDGTQVVINKDDEYLPAVGGSPFDLLPTELVYPITITQFGQDIVLNNDNDVCQFYETLGEPCANKPAHIQFFFNEGAGTRISCAYFINYPFDIVSDGDTLQIQTGDEYLTELNSSPNAYGDIELLYPATATKFDDGSQLNFNSDSDICSYLNNCQ